jgi:fructokinase
VIVTAGEALVDLVEQGVSVRAVAGGGPFNTAIALGRLDVDVGFLGTLSRDSYGQMLARELHDAGVDTSLVRWSDDPTPRALVRHERDGTNEYSFLLSGTALADLAPEELPGLPARAWALHVGTLALAVDPPASAYEALVQREARRRQIVFDPNVRPVIFGDASMYRNRFERLARLADVVKLSRDDAEWIYPSVSVDEVLDLILAFGPRIVALTLGADGAVAKSSDGCVTVPGMPVPVADTVGAGDSFGAALIASLVDEGAFGPATVIAADTAVLRRAVAYAVAASAITCSRTGAAPPTRREIEAQLHGIELATEGA